MRLRATAILAECLVPSLQLVCTIILLLAHTGSNLSERTWVVSHVSAGDGPTQHWMDHHKTVQGKLVEINKAIYVSTTITRLLQPLTEGVLHCGRRGPDTLVVNTAGRSMKPITRQAVTQHAAFPLTCYWPLTCTAANSCPAVLTLKTPLCPST
jgi:hypothetical protein